MNVNLTSNIHILNKIKAAITDKVDQELFGARFPTNF